MKWASLTQIGKRALLTLCLCEESFEEGWEEKRLRRDSLRISLRSLRRLVGIGRFELPTSCMSSKRSNQLS